MPLLLATTLFITYKYSLTIRAYRNTLLLLLYKLYLLLAA